MEQKEIKITRNEAIILNQILAGIKVKGMGVDARRKMIGLKLDLGRMAKTAEDFQKQTVESHKPENFKELQAIDTEAGKKEFEKLSKEIESKVYEVLNPYYEELVTIHFDGIAAEEFDILSEQNELNLSALEFLNKKLLA